MIASRPSHTPHVVLPKQEVLPDEATADPEEVSETQETEDLPEEEPSQAPWVASRTLRRYVKELEKLLRRERLKRIKAELALEGFTKE